MRVSELIAARAAPLSASRPCGVREGVEDERFDDAIRYVQLTADALDAYSARLGEAMRVLNSSNEQ